MRGFDVILILCYLSMSRYVSLKTRKKKTNIFFYSIRSGFRETRQKLAMMDIRFALYIAVLQQRADKATGRRCDSEKAIQMLQ